MKVFFEEAGHKYYNEAGTQENYYVYALLDPRKKKNIYLSETDSPLEYEPFYIGKGCKLRINSHLGKDSLSKNFLKKNKIRNIRKEGLEPIKKILLSGLKEMTAYEKEANIIATLGRINKKTGILVNLTDGGIGAIGKIVSEEAKERMKCVQKGNNTGVLNGKSKTVYQYTIDGLFIKEWQSGRMAGNALSINNREISQCALGNTKTAGNYVWRYNYTGNIIEPISFNKKPTWLLKRGYKEVKSININTLEEKTFKNSRECAEFYDIDTSLVNYHITKGKTGEHKKLGVRFIRCLA